MKDIQDAITARQGKPVHSLCELCVFPKLYDTAAKMLKEAGEKYALNCELASTLVQAAFNTVAVYDADFWQLIGEGEWGLAYHDAPELFSLVLPPPVAAYVTCVELAYRTETHAYWVFEVTSGTNPRGEIANLELEVRRASSAECVTVASEVIRLFGDTLRGEILNRSGQK